MKKIIIPVLKTLSAALFCVAVFSGCSSGHSSGDFALFSDAYRIVRDDYVEEVSGETLVLEAESGLQHMLRPEDPEGYAQVAPFDLEARIKGSADDDLLSVFIRYMRVLAHSVAHSEHELERAALDGMFAYLNEEYEDPHSRVMDAIETRNLQDQIDGDFGGLGMVVRKVEDPFETVEVMYVIPGSPAKEAGIVTGDFIVRVESESTAAMTINEVVDLLRGRKGTSVTITIRQGNTDTEKTLERDSIEALTVISHSIEEIGVQSILDDYSQSYNLESATEPVSYIQFIGGFPSNLAGRLEEAVQNHKSVDQNDVDYFVFDLRGNPGGLLDSAIAVSDLFLSSGIITTIQTRDNYDSKMASGKKILGTNDVLMILVDENTASAAEIFSGALQTQGRAELVGEENSYGKGSGQTIYALNGASLRVTTLRWYLPDGTSVAPDGLEPDILIEADEDQNADENEESFFAEVDLEGDEALRRAIVEMYSLTTN